MDKLKIVYEPHIIYMKNGYVKKAATHNGELLDTVCLYTFEDDKYCPICDTKLIWGPCKYCELCNLYWQTCSDEEAIDAYRKYNFPSSYYGKDKNE